MSGFMFLLVIGSTIWVGIDSSNLKMQRGRLGHSHLDMSTTSWVVCCLLLWIVAFPCYLVARSKYVALNSGPMAYGQAAWNAPQAQAVGYQQPQSYPAPVYPAPQQQVAPAAAPPQLSPDGHWWWDGQQWTPVVQPAAGADPQR